MTCQLCSVAAVLVIAVCGTGSVDALELSSANWDAAVAGKTVFLKFYAPWCGHCKKLKPDWDRLMQDFEGAEEGLVADVDCTAKGKEICEEHGVKGYPKLMWGEATDLKEYIGARSYTEMKKFADDHLGMSCGPGSLWLCDEARKKSLQAFMRRPPEKLDEMVKTAEQQLKKAEYFFKKAEYDLTNKIIAAEQKKNKKISTVRKKGGLPKGKGSVLDLALEDWEEHTEGKTVFLKFFAPWCGHCKAVKPAWDRLSGDYAGTSTALVAEVDCTARGKTLCEKHGVDGFPRLLYGQPDEQLAPYRGGRTYQELKSFAQEQLGDSCGSGNIDVCDESHKKFAKKMEELTPEEREERQKEMDKAVDRAEKKFQDRQWNLTAQIDVAEQKKNDQIKAIKAQGLEEAKQVQAWNNEQPEGFWTPPPTAPQPPPAPEDFLESVFFEVAGVDMTGYKILSCLIALALPMIFAFRSGSKQEEAAVYCEGRQILMEGKADICQVKARLEAGEDFSELAKECSKCNSSAEGGALGRHAQGSMAPAIDKACFDPETKVGEVIGPIETKFGFHLLLLDARHGIPEPATPNEPAEASKEEAKKDK